MKSVRYFVFFLVLIPLLSGLNAQPKPRSSTSNNDVVQFTPPPPPDPTNVVPIPGLVWLMVAGLGLGIKHLMVNSKKK